MHIIAIDPSIRSTGITSLTLEPGEGTFELEKQTIKSTKDDERIQVLENLFRSVYEQSRTNETCFGVVEGYSYMSQGNAVTQTIEAGAACRLGLSVASVPLVEIPPSVWKNAVLLNGQASKKEIRQKVGQLLEGRPKNPITRMFLHYVKEWDNQDELDSLLLLICFFVILIKTPRRFHAERPRSGKVLNALRSAILESAKTFLNA